MSFDALARHYGWMEFTLAGNKLQRCRTAFLDQVDHCKNVLIVGEGNGRFLLECRRALENAHITCVDASSRMLTLAQERLQRHGLALDSIQFVHEDALVWRPPNCAFDLIVTHFFLDCFRPDELMRLVSRLGRAATLDANWLLADFQIPQAGWSRSRALLIHFLMYRFFRLATRLAARKLTVPDELLKRVNFVISERRLSDWGLLHTDLWKRATTVRL